MRVAVRQAMLLRSPDTAKAVVETPTRVSRLHGGVETSVLFERVAFVDPMGRIEQDGYAATGSRRRAAPRRNAVAMVPWYI